MLRTWKSGTTPDAFHTQLIFHLLNGKLFHPTSTVTYNDVNFGIPSFMTCIESLIFSLIFQWSYSSREYHERHDRFGAPAVQMGTFRACLDCMNLSDIIVGMATAIQLLFMRVKSRYGGAAPPQRQKTLRMEVDTVHLEPMSDRRQRGYSNVPDGQTEYDPLDAFYNGSMGAPHMPWPPGIRRQLAGPRRSVLTTCGLSLTGRTLWSAGGWRIRGTRALRDFRRRGRKICCDRRVGMRGV